MKRREALKLVARLAVALGPGTLVACMSLPEVVQGTVVRYEGETKVLVVRDERPPGKELAFSLRSAEIGAEPEVGDLVRIAYHDRGGRLEAGRVMNLTRQKEIGRGGPARK